MVRSSVEQGHDIGKVDKGEKDGVGGKKTQLGCGMHNSHLDQMLEEGGLEGSKIHRPKQFGD